MLMVVSSFSMYTLILPRGWMRVKYGSVKPSVGVSEPAIDRTPMCNSVRHGQGRSLCKQEARTCVVRRPRSGRVKRLGRPETATGRALSPLPTLSPLKKKKGEKGLFDPFFPLLSPPLLSLSLRGRLGGRTGRTGRQRSIESAPVGMGFRDSRLFHPPTSGPVYDTLSSSSPSSSSA